VLEANNHDRYYNVLGLKAGASLQEIEEAWRQRSAEFHPDKFPADSKVWATGKTQEINNARDELRRYWRERREADRVEAEYQLHVRRAPPQPEPAPVQPDIVDFEPAPAPSPDSLAAADQPAAPGLGRGAVLVYSLAVVFVFVALLAASAALLFEPTGGRATAQQPADTPLQVVVDRPQPAEAAPSREPPAVPAAIASGDTSAAADATPATSVAAEPRPPADPAPEPREATAEALPKAAAEPREGTAETPPKAAAETTETPATTPPPSDTGIQVPTMPPAPSPRAARPPQAETGRARAKTDRRLDEAPTVRSATSPSGKPVQQPQRAGRDPVFVAAIQTCRSDMQRLCSNIQPGGGRIAQCVRTHFRELSPGCSQALLAARSARREGVNPAGRH
jgi:hypothetical protein